MRVVFCEPHIHNERYGRYNLYFHITLFDTEIGLCSSDGSRKRSVGGEVKNLFDAFGWQDYICATLVGFSGGQLREMLRSVACRHMENDWAEDLGSKPKLCILNSVCVNGYDGRCWKVRKKNHRRVLMMLRGGSVSFQIETGRWKGVPREERVCRECEMTEEIEDCNHWLLRCPQ